MGRQTPYCGDADSFLRGRKSGICRRGYEDAHAGSHLEALHQRLWKIYEKEPEKQVFVQQGEKILEAVRKGEDGG